MKKGYLSAVLRQSTIQLLRFHFSFFLVPVFLFALSQVSVINPGNAILVFFILHLLIYPSSNGYNSYMDKDTTPIGGLKKPLLPTKQLFWVTVAMDIVAVALSFIISYYFAAGVLLYILASRAYSYRGIRLKKYAFAGYLLVVIFQGGVVFFLSYHGVSNTLDVPVLPIIVATCLIGGYYPLTQVYQHAEDSLDGVRTISYALGKKGTFVFCGIVFATATLFMYLTFWRNRNMEQFWIFVLCMSPVLAFFSRWMYFVWKDERNANFRHSLTMNVLAASCTTLCFTILLLKKYLE